MKAKNRKPTVGATASEPEGRVAPQAQRPEVSGAKPYTPTTTERVALESFRAKCAKRSPTPQLTVSKDEKDGKSFTQVKHLDPVTGGTLLAASIGLADQAATEGLLNQLVNVATIGRTPDEPSVNFALSMVQGIAPRDEVEAMLAAQMVAVHNASMTFARRLNHVDNIAQQDSASNAFNKLTRTFAAQMEALNRYRGKGQQAIRVEHVTVNAGGQAIVGNVTPSGGIAAKMKEQPHAPQNESIAALPSPDPSRDALPVAESARPEAVQDARRGYGKRRTQGQSECMEARGVQCKDLGSVEAVQDSGTRRNGLREGAGQP